MTEDEFKDRTNGLEKVKEKQKDQGNRALRLFTGKQAEIVERLIRLEELVVTEYWSIPVMLEMVAVSEEVNKLFSEEYDDRDDPGALMVGEAHDDFGHLFFQLFMRPETMNRRQITGVLHKLVSSIYMGDLAYSHIGGKPLHLQEDAQ